MDFIRLIKHENMFGYILSKMDRANNSLEKGRVVQSALRELYLGHISASQYSERGVSTLAAYDTQETLKDDNP